MIVVHKPPDWEVDNQARMQEQQQQQQQTSASDQPLPLSAWLRSVLPRSQCPLPWMPDLDFGFLHRLDVPSSGLILCGTNFSGLFALRWQLDTYRVERHYVVFGHGRAAADLREVVMNIDPATVDSRRSFASELCGKPAKTRLKPSAHVAAPAHRPLARRDDRDTYSAFAICIRTGRRHQIRVHLLHSGHPTAVDCKYGAEAVLLRRPAAFELAGLCSRGPEQGRAVSLHAASSSE